MEHENRTSSVKIPLLDNLFRGPLALLVRFVGFTALAAAGQIAVFYFADACGRLGYPAVGEAYMSVALFVYAPGLRLFWLITPKPAPFDVLYGVLGMFFILATYSILLGAIATCSYGLVGRALHHFGGQLRRTGPRSISV
jgi:hypothetical protein